MSWKEIKGGAESLALNADITAGSASFVASTVPSANWPTGVRPFVVVMGRNTSSEEKMLCSARAGSNFTVTTRGYDGTTAVGHTAGQKIEHCTDSDTIQEVNSHVGDVSRDDHSQYINVARHDLTTRHQFGAALGSPAAPPNIAAAGAAGAGASPARSDHTHGVPNSLITYAMVQNVSASPRLLGRTTAGAGVIEELTAGAGLVLSAGALGRAAFTGDVTAAADSNALVIGANKVLTSMILDANVTTAKLLDANVTSAKLELALPKGRLAYASATADQALPDLTTTDLTGLSITFTPFNAARLIRLTLYLPQLLAGATGVAFTALIMEGATQIQKGIFNNVNATGSAFFCVQALVIPTNAAHTYKASVAVNGSASTMKASVFNPSFLLAEDMGPQ